MDEKVRAHLMISGRVQGVFYRMETQRAAGRLGVTGWVRNKPNGMVEAVATGEKKAVDALIQWCRTGPPASRVEHVEVTWMPYREEFSTFDITYDG